MLYNAPSLQYPSKPQTHEMLIWIKWLYFYGPSQNLDIHKRMFIYFPKECFIQKSLLWKRWTKKKLDLFLYQIEIYINKLLMI